ncbi:MAG: nucleotidyltransferase domain-containing protein [Salinivirgaceae bacterium]|nr:nucleotidyltransferase domain-containing protein [Salinivirgaceae bacterium]
MSNFNNTGISENDLENIINIFRKKSKVTHVILFGSRAKGTHSNGSDIDLAIKGKGLQLNDILDLSVELDELLLPYKFDIVIINRITEPDLLEHINCVGIDLLIQQATQ